MKFTPTHIYFWSGIYSNWHPAPLTDFRTHNSFANTEQAFMWYKAMYFNDFEIATRILNETDPYNVKKLGRQVKGFDAEKWSNVCETFMTYVCFLKFSQNADFKKELLETGDKTLVEASPKDKIWGIGLGEDDPRVLDEKQWLGQNLLGKALMEVRKAIRENRDLTLKLEDGNVTS